MCISIFRPQLKVVIPKSVRFYLPFLSSPLPRGSPYLGTFSVWRLKCRATGLLPHPCHICKGLKFSPKRSYQIASKYPDNFQANPLNWKAVCLMLGSWPQVNTWPACWRQAPLPSQCFSGRLSAGGRGLRPRSNTYPWKRLAKTTHAEVCHSLPVGTHGPDVEVGAKGVWNLRGRPKAWWPLMFPL